MAASIFVDTNVLLRAFHDTFPEHGFIRAWVDRTRTEDVEFWISRQVIREYLVQVTHPRTFTEPLSWQAISTQLERIMSLCRVADDTAQVTTHLLNLLSSYLVTGKQIHDANIVATMLANGIVTLVTLNVADFTRFADRVTIVTPDGT